MKHGLNVFLSQRIEDLASHLEKALYTPDSTPFTRRLIVVHGPAMRNWLLQRLSRGLGVAMGFEIIYLNQAFSYLQKILYPNIEARPHFPNSLELSLALEWEIRQVLSTISNAEQPPEPWHPLLQYLKVSPKGGFTKRSNKRLVGLCEQLARLFIDYGKYGGMRLNDWESGRDSQWQAVLWQRIFSKYPQWTTPYHAFNNAHSKPTNVSVQLHLFSISFLTSLEYRYLNQLAQTTPINHYLLSPCALFWSDICSDRERIRLKAQAPEKQRQPLDEFLRDRNPLLANFGRLGREMAKTIEESSALISEAYTITTGTLQYPDYVEQITDDFRIAEQNIPFSLLQGIQIDMLLLRNPDSTDPLELSGKDESIQVHLASSRMRETEILYNNLLAILDRHKNDEDPIKPKDILVMAPAIGDYAPYIKAIFEAHDSLLDYQIVDLEMSSQSQIVQGFLHLISLSQSRWDAATLLQLFDYPAFQHKHQLSREDLFTIRDWIKKGGIRWGEDSGHRQELLFESHCQNPLVEKSNSGTWEQGFNRLLRGLVDEDADEGVENIEMTRGELLGKLIRLIRSLRSDLKPLSNGSLLTLEDWATYLDCLFDAYFSIDFSDSESNDEIKVLRDQIHQLRKSGGAFENTAFSFITIRKQLESLLKSKSVGCRENHLQAVRFCSLLPMRAIPGKVIALLGMEEGAFPRPEKASSLNILRKDPDADYQPSQTDYDRYLFLEALLSSRQYLIISAQGQNDKGQEQILSLLVTELISYLDRAFILNGQKPSKFCIKKHPFHAFDQSYFNSKSDLFNFSHHDYKAALVHYKPQKSPRHTFSPSFAIRQERTTPMPQQIDLKHLLDMAKNPIKAHFQQTLGIYLDSTEKRQVKIDDDFLISALDLHILKKEALKRPLEAVIKSAENRGKLPVGAFKPLAIKKLQEAVDEWKDGLKALSIKPEDLFDIEFNISCESAQQVSDTRWIAPPLIIPYQNTSIKIIGKLSDVTSEGLVSFSENKLKEAAEIWPAFLAALLARTSSRLPIKPKLAFVESTKSKESFFDDPVKRLETFLDYYLLARNQLSPLMPEWIQSLLNDQPDEFHKSVEKSINEDDTHTFKDQYLLWSLREVAILKEKEHFDAWKEKAQSLYGDLALNWYSKKEKEDPNE